MGITGLLPFVKAASSPKHLSELRGQTAAVDTYCWLHKGAFGCAQQIVKGEHTTAYVNYCMKYITMLQQFNIKPIMVFDGRHLPAKKETELKRRQNRSQSKKKAVEALSLGKIQEARSHFQRCVDITPEMAFELIKELRRRQIDYIVAPYEADPQLAFLNRNKIADFVISEDSDLLTFGCEKVLFKLALSGAGTLVEANKLFLATNERPEDFTLARFRHLCIISGCDYVDSLPGIGLKKALKFLKAFPQSSLEDALPKLPAQLKMQHLTITKEYIDNVLTADATFKHQYIFNPITKALEPLFALDLLGSNARYCLNAGTDFGQKLAYQLAIGNLNPLTMNVLDNWAPTNANTCSTSIWFNKSPNKSNKPATVTSYFKSTATQSTSFDKPTKRKSVAFQPTPIEERIYDCEIEDTVVKFYAQPESPPAKRVCVESPDKDENSSSPILSSRRSIINPFLRNAKAKQSIAFDNAAAPVNGSELPASDYEIVEIQKPTGNPARKSTLTHVEMSNDRKLLKIQFKPDIEISSESIAKCPYCPDYDISHHFWHPLKCHGCVCCSLRKCDYEHFERNIYGCQQINDTILRFSKKPPLKKKKQSKEPMIETSSQKENVQSSANMENKMSQVTKMVSLSAENEQNGDEAHELLNDTQIVDLCETNEQTESHEINENVLDKINKERILPKYSSTVFKPGKKSKPKKETNKFKKGSSSGQPTLKMFGFKKT